ncbi:MAG: heparinase [Limnobacter sp.]|nr:heparinase [Limnobacter sp.]
MGAAEIAWRSKQLSRAYLERAGVGLARPRQPSGRCARPWVSPLPRGFDPEPYAAAADRILSGRFDLFAMRGAPLGFPPRWNVDPKTGTQVPLRFGKLIDYRDASLCGDIKYLWELNRHLELVTLAQAWHLTGRRRYADACRELLGSWFEQCPYPLGPNWTSSLEHAIRLVNWALAWHLLGAEDSPLFDGDAGQAFRAAWLRAVREHCHFIAGWFSRFSSANNHLLGEQAGLLVGALTWPLWPESQRWIELARAGFERECLVQNAPDGVNREQAIWYQHAVMDTMLIAALVARANGIEFSAGFWQRLESMTEYLAALMDRGAEVPMLGDGDDSVLVRWAQPAPAAPYRSLLASGVLLFGRGDWKARASGFDDRNRWLFGDRACELYRAVAASGPDRRRREFPDGGRYIIGARFGCVDEVLATIDAGPTGYPVIAAHGHADALALTLSAGGRLLLIDPGTFAYHTEPKWRGYFRSTSAHNTACVDGLDQSESGGSFLWLRKARARCTRFVPEGDVQWFEGEHDGYTRLPDPVVHRRRIGFDASRNRFEIGDEFDCAGRHAVQICWHFCESCQLEQADGIVVVRAGQVELRLSMAPAAMPPRILRGSVEPLAGWISRAFDVKVPCPTVVWDCSVTGTTRFVTIVELAFSALPAGGHLSDHGACVA